MSTRKPPVPPVIVEVPVDELRAAQRVLKTAALTTDVRSIVSAQVQVLSLLTQMLMRPRRIAQGGGA
jgi:hypothetical protein